MAIQSAPLQGEDCDEAGHAAVATVSGMGNSQVNGEGDLPPVDGGSEGGCLPEIRYRIWEKEH